MGAIIALGGFHPVHAEPSAEGPERPYSIVAQSTAATAATGRRPIGQRIAASNLGVRPAVAPVGAAVPAADEADSGPAGIVVPIGTDPVVSADADTASDTLAPDSEQSLTPADTLAPPVTVPAPLAAEAVGDEAVPDEAAPDETVGEEPAGEADAKPAEPAPLHVHDATPATKTRRPGAAHRGRAVPPVPLSGVRPDANPVVRENLLGRIKAAFGMQPRAAQASSKARRPAERTHPRTDPSEAGQQGADLLGESAAVPGPLPERADEPPAPSPVDGAPARLEFDVSESRTLVGEGEQILMRIAVRNVGGAAAERVTATLFFAEGVEPVQAVGHAAQVYPGEVRFEPVSNLSPGESVDLLVTAVGTRPGSVAYRGEIECAEPAAQVAREGTVTVLARQATP